MDADKKTDAELLALLAGCPKEGTLWKHYKTGNLYWINGRAICEATQEPMVIYYRQNSGGLVFARPLREWEELVESEGQQVSRFRRA